MILRKSCLEPTHPNSSQACGASVWFQETMKVHFYSIGLGLSSKFYFFKLPGDSVAQPGLGTSGLVYFLSFQQDRSQGKQEQGIYFIIALGCVHQCSQTLVAPTCAWLPSLPTLLRQYSLLSSTEKHESPTLHTPVSAWLSTPEKCTVREEIRKL